jgi:chaperone modulatory protein CbpM
MSSQVEEDRARADSKAGKTGTLLLRRTQHFLLPIEDLARAAGLHISLLEKLVEYGVIEPVPDIPSPLLFPASAIDRLRCVMRLRRDLGVNLAGAAVIVEMGERLRSLRVELERLHKLAKL